MINLLDYTRPFASLIPTIKKPKSALKLQEKLLWTSTCLIIYLIASQVQLFGTILSNKDPLYLMRKMMASAKGSLMDQGISPIISAGMVLQFIKGIGLIGKIQIEEDEILLGCLEKMVTMAIVLGQGLVQITSGMYGPVSELRLSGVAVLLAQLCVSGGIVMFLDDLLTIYGIGSGVNLFIATNVCESIVWQSFSPKVYKTGRGLQFEGSVISFLHLLLTRKAKVGAIVESFTRQSLPNLSQLFMTSFLFAAVIYLQGLRIDVTVESKDVRNKRGKFPLRLLHASTMPIIVQGHILTHTVSFSKFLYKRFPKNILVRILGVWDSKEENFNSFPTGGICLFLCPNRFLKSISLSGLISMLRSAYNLVFNPKSFIRVLKKMMKSKKYSVFILKGIFGDFTRFSTDLLVSLIYIAVTLTTGAFISRFWADMNNSGSKQLSNKLKNERMKIVGISEDDTVKYFDKYVPAAGFVSGLVVGAIVILSELCGTIGSGTNMFLAVGIIWKWLEMSAEEGLKKGQKVL